MINKKNNKSIIKIAIVIIGLILYVGMLIFISVNQSDYSVVLTTDKEVYEFSQNEKEYVIDVKVQNNANRMLSSAEDQNTFLSYHVYNMNGEPLAYDNIRSPFIENIFAKENGETELHISPLAKGEYLIGIDVLQEYVTWFNEKENTEIRIRLIVK